mmetsp:Transcript_32390/g.78842  ORF Transcript_32390/g.78842 Transcript_32390/m.78842 type:complete len:310 (-) Transcript_32390:196-1125(-)|eukprot:CAMPEP_0114538524 /NCGR_PEP_ID=MMETSP0109-20121206/30192_1 /TAXON_ID=29199 /ORGANISM="Chlorarachnion reptans, Strain CCCM449" /LENGTH=309 /DNA_ID=CAMNT_0001722555 /DNA_START=647 /DNA_END=1576 /DNA_ORIENTATION=+
MMRKGLSLEGAPEKGDDIYTPREFTDRIPTEDSARSLAQKQLQPVFNVFERAIPGTPPLPERAQTRLTLPTDISSAFAFQVDIPQLETWFDSKDLPSSEDCPGRNSFIPSVPKPSAGIALDNGGTGLRSSPGSSENKILHSLVVPSVPKPRERVALGNEGTVSRSSPGSIENKILHSFIEPSVPKPPERVALGNEGTVSWSTPISSHLTPTGRTKKACGPCHQKKLKCIRDMGPGKSCKRCRECFVDCTAYEKKRRILHSPRKPLLKDSENKHRGMPCQGRMKGCKRPFRHPGHCRVKPPRKRGGGRKK